MTTAPSYSASDLLLFTHVLDQIAHEAGGLDEPTRARMGLRITMAAASGIRAVPELIAYARAEP